MKITYLIFAIALGMLGCGSPDASTLTHPVRKYVFPMYISMPGTAAGQGVIYQINAPTAVDAYVEATPVMSGLDFPSGIAVSKTGTVYFAERPGKESGRVMRFAPGDSSATLVASGLQDPQGLAFDLAEKLYVTESRAGRLSRVNPDGSMEEILGNLVQPRTISVDEADRIYITEIGAGSASRVFVDGTKEEITSAIVQPLAADMAFNGDVFVLSNHAGMGSGKLIQVTQSGTNHDYISSLVNPQSYGWEDGNILFVAEGSPANRIIKYSKVTNNRTVLTKFNGQMHSIALTPRH